MKRLIFLLCYVTAGIAVPPNTFYHYDTNHYLLYPWGIFNDLANNPDVAQYCYEEILRTSGSPYTYSGYINHLFEQKEYSKILALLPQIEEQLADNLPVQLIFVKTYELSGMAEAADKKILELSRRFKENAEVMYYACISQLRNKKAASALTLAQDFLDNSSHKSSHFIFYYIKAQAQISLYKHEEARENIKKCLELNPGFEQGWLLSGLIAELEGKVDQALKGYRTFLQLVGHDAAVEQQILNLLVKAQAMGTSVQTNPLESAVMQYRNKNYKQALLTVEQYLDQQSNDRQGHLLKLELLCCVNRQKDAVNHLKYLINKEPQEDTWYRALHLMYLAGLEQDAIITVLKSFEKQPKNNLSTLYLADIFLKKRQLTTALELLNKALTNAQAPLQEKIIYQIALIYYETNQLNQLQDVITKAEASPVTFAPLQNLLAYYYATKKENITKAQSYLDRALKQESANIHYLDTQALIWYKQKEYDKAYALLDSVLKKAPTDYFMLKHMSKVMYQRGKNNDALACLKKAEACATLEHEKQKIAKLLKRWTTIPTALTYHDNK